MLPLCSGSRKRKKKEEGKKTHSHHYSWGFFQQSGYPVSSSTHSPPGYCCSKEIMRSAGLPGLGLAGLERSVSNISCKDGRETYLAKEEAAFLHRAPTNTTRAHELLALGAGQERRLFLLETGGTLDQSAGLLRQDAALLRRSLMVGLLGLLVDAADCVAERTTALVLSAPEIARIELAAMVRVLITPVVRPDLSLGAATHNVHL